MVRRAMKLLMKSMKMGTRTEDQMGLKIMKIL